MTTGQNGIGFPSWPARQGDAERRYGDFKGPLAVTPVFVQHNRRVAALVQVICLALLVFCLIERQVRQRWNAMETAQCPGPTRAAAECGPRAG